MTEKIETIEQADALLASIDAEMAGWKAPRAPLTPRDAEQQPQQPPVATVRRVDRNQPSAPVLSDQEVRDAITKAHHGVPSSESITIQRAELDVLNAEFPTNDARNAAGWARFESDAAEAEARRAEQDGANAKPKGWDY